jgi:hypothetical protein
MIKLQIQLRALNSLLSTLHTTCPEHLVGERVLFAALPNVTIVKRRQSS